MNQHQEKIFDFVEKHGMHYSPAPLPAGIIRGKIGDCFDTSILNAAINKELIYVEGYARDITTGFWIYHAWLSDKKTMHVYDPTWRMIIKGEDHPVPTKYIGIELDTEAVIKFMLETEYKAVLENGWRAPALANATIKYIGEELYKVYGYDID